MRNIFNNQHNLEGNLNKEKDLFLPICAARYKRKHNRLQRGTGEYSDPQTFSSKIQPETQHCCYRDSE